MTSVSNKAGLATPVVISWAGYFEVQLKKAVTVDEHLYRPGPKHVVNQAVLTAMGDAVLNVKPAG